MGLSRRERREQRKHALKEQWQSELHNLDVSEKKETHSKHSGFLGVYDKHYKALLIIPLLLFVLAIAGMIYQVATTGDFINKGVSLKGGVVITVPVATPVDINEISRMISAQYPKDDIEVRSTDEFGVQKAIIITTDNLNAEKGILTLISSKIPDAQKSASSETTGSSLGSGFFTQTMLAMGIAFLCMAIVVFISFRTFVPSIAVITCAFADILETMVVTNLLGIKVSTAGIAAFLMLIGYSVDTDILLTNRVLRGKEGTVFDRTLSAAKTGLLMTGTAIIAVTISLILTNSATIKEIMTITLVGLVLDIINTWLQNTAWLRMYMESRKVKPKKEFREVEPEVIETEEDAQAQ